MKSCPLLHRYISINRRSRTEDIRRGFTLIEVLVSVSILSFGIIGVLEAFSLSLRAGSRAAHLGEAVDVAQRELELTAVATASGGDLMPQTGKSGRYNWELKLREIQHGLTLATVEVKWLERGKHDTFKLSRVLLPDKQESN